MSKIRIRWNDHRQTWEAVEDFTVILAFSKCHEAERWVEAEMKRREAAA